MLYVQYFNLRKRSSVLIDTHLIGIPSAKIGFTIKKRRNPLGCTAFRRSNSSFNCFTSSFHCSHKTPLEVRSRVSIHFLLTALSSLLRCFGSWQLHYIIVDISSSSYSLSRKRVSDAQWWIPGVVVALLFCVVKLSVSTLILHESPFLRVGTECTTPWYPSTSANLYLWIASQQNLLQPAPASYTSILLVGLVPSPTPSLKGVPMVDPCFNHLMCTGGPCRLPGHAFPQMEAVPGAKRSKGPEQLWIVFPCISNFKCKMDPVGSGVFPHPSTPKTSTLGPHLVS